MHASFFSFIHYFTLALEGSLVHKNHPKIRSQQGGCRDGNQTNFKMIFAVLPLVSYLILPSPQTSIIIVKPHSTYTIWVKSEKGVHVNYQ